MALDHSVHRDLYAPGPPSKTRLAATSEEIWQGSMVGIDTADGLLKKVTESTTLNILGVSECELNTANLDEEDRWIPVGHGTYADFASAPDADLIEADDVTKDCYGVDDDTVALTDGSGTRSRAGSIHAVTEDGRVVVRFQEK